jgi:hypothetical protein
LIFFLLWPLVRLITSVEHVVMSHWSQTKKSDLSLAQLLDRWPIELMEVWIFHLELLRNLSHFLKIDQLTIIEPSLMEIVDHVVHVNTGSFTLLDDEFSDWSVSKNVSLS